MIKIMTRGNQENIVGSVQGRQVGEVEEEAEEMKTENLEGMGNIEGNVSSEFTNGNSKLYRK
jgi:hypothetical protein